jgi:hypothetical protein
MPPGDGLADQGPDLIKNITIFDNRQRKFIINPAIK